MPRYEITSPDGKRFEVTAPDGASQADVLSYAQRQFAPIPKEAPYDPTADMSFGQKALAGVGAGMTDIWQGVKQRTGFATPQEVAEKRATDEPLKDTAGGAIGNVVGNIAATAPALFIPGANSVVGAGLVGAGLGALQPTTADESVVKNAALGGAMGAGAQYGIGKLATAAGNRLTAAEAASATKATQNAPRDAVLQAGRSEGYVFTPSQSGAGIGSRVLEGVSGKAKTEQLAATKNQNVTERLAKRALGIAEDQPINSSTLEAVRADAYKTGYKPIVDIPAIAPDNAFVAEVQSLSPKSSGGAVKSPAQGEIEDIIGSLSGQPQWTGAQLVGDIRKLREIARTNYASAARDGGNVGKSDLGRFASSAADSLEELAARNLGDPQAIQAFRASRELIAKTHSVEDAMKGNSVNAKALGNALKNGKKLSGDLKLIAQTANDFGDVMGVPKSGWTSPITALDAFGAAGMAGMGAGVGSVALPAARVAARSAILSPMYQKAFVSGPNYAPGLLTQTAPKTLEEMRRLGISGLLGDTR